METTHGALDRYWKLSCDTYAYQAKMKEVGVLTAPTWFDVSWTRQCRETLSRSIPSEHHDFALFDRLEAWACEYERIDQASPKWRLKQMIRDVSESHACLSWPRRWERIVWEWAILQGSPDPCPFDDRNSIFDATFHRRMRELIDKCDGFLYRCEETGQIVFAPTATLPQIWRHQEHLAAIDRAKPFGFFNDALTPGWEKHWSGPTEEEERMMDIIRRANERRHGWRGLTKHLKRIFQPKA